jgi:pimeloyl-ACP methyl ester carboxylesterase
MPDLRGHGGSTNPSGTFTHRQAALDMFALLDQLGIRGFKAMGISSGGMTLLHMATQQPQRVEAMVLIGATTFFPEQARVIQRHMAAPESLPPTMLKAMRECAPRGDAQIRDLVRQVNGFKDSYDDMNFTEPFLHTITARTLIVHGDRDAFFPVAIPVQEYGAIPHSYLWIVPNGSHVPIFEPQAKQFEELALSFLRGDWEAH